MLDENENLSDIISNLKRDYNSLFEHSKVGVAYVNKDGKFIDANKRFCEITKYEKNELLNLNFIDITHKDDIEKDLDLHNKSLKDLRQNSFSLEKRYIQKDSQVIWVEIFTNHIRDEKGNYLHTLAFVNDISKRKKIQDTILEQTKTMQLYLDIVDVMIIALDTNGNITLVNRKACETLAYEEYEIVGRNWFKNFLVDEDFEKVYEYFKKVINKDEQWQEKFTNQIKSKEGIRTISWRNKILEDKDKNIIGIISSGEDITDILRLEEDNKKREEALYHQSKLASMGEMIRNISHQWRQPLSTISTAASGLKIQKELSVLKDEDLDNSLEAIVNTTKYLSQTIDDFQNFFKIDNHSSTFSLESLIKNIRNLISSSYKSNDIELLVELKTQKKFKGPFNEIIQTMLNILNNAKDAFLDKNIDKKAVMLSLDILENESLQIVIKDNAGGIPNDILNKVFEPYFTTKHQSLGTGIGLYMVKDIIENRLYGEVEFKNDLFEYEETTRKGAIFKLTIPRAID